jgi:2',3'-cyclic-nucleotide 2'-phosphodiesterase (5'-nucleotidase family)
VNSTGGFRRRATYVKDQRRLAEYVLLLDAGDALVGDGGAENEAAAEKVIAGMNLMGYDAMAIGPMELGLGAAGLRELLARAEFPVLSANALWRADQQLVGQPYTIIDAGAYKIGVVGITRLPGEELSDYTVLDPEEVLEEVLTEVREQADTVLVLTNIPYRSALDLAGAVGGMDLIVAALPRQLPSRALRVPKTGTLVLTAEQPLTGHSGRRIGKLVVRVGGDGRLSEEEWESVALGPGIRDDPGMRLLLGRYDD